MTFIPGSAPPTYYLTVGQFAKRTGTQTRLIEWWVERGFIRADYRVHPRRRMIPSTEIPVVEQVLSIVTSLGVKASERLFEVTRDAKAA